MWQRFAGLAGIGVLGLALAACGSNSSTTTTTKAPTATTSAPKTTEVLPGVPTQPLADTAANAPTNASYACQWDTALRNLLTGSQGQVDEAASDAGDQGEHDAEQIASFADSAGVNDPTYAQLKSDADALETYGGGPDATWGVLSKVANAPQVIAVENDCSNLPS
jgi:hypothetical protein